MGRSDSPGALALGGGMIPPHSESRLARCDAPAMPGREYRIVKRIISQFGKRLSFTPHYTYGGPVVSRICRTVFRQGRESAPFIQGLGQCRD